MAEMAVAVSDAALELAEALYTLRAHRAALAEAARRHTRERSTRAKRAVRDARATVDAAIRRAVEIGREVGRLSASSLPVRQHHPSVPPGRQAAADRGSPQALTGPGCACPLPYS